MTDGTGNLSCANVDKVLMALWANEKLGVSTHCFDPAGTFFACKFRNIVGCTNASWHVASYDASVKVQSLVCATPLHYEGPPSGLPASPKISPLFFYYEYIFICSAAPIVRSGQFFECELGSSFYAFPHSRQVLSDPEIEVINPLYRSTHLDSSPRAKNMLSRSGITQLRAGMVLRPLIYIVRKIEHDEDYQVTIKSK